MNRTTAFLAALAALAAAAPLRANDQDVRGTTVPATACQPASTASAEKLQLSNAAWVFASGATGTVYLYCPLAINGNTVSDASDDNDASSYRIYYRDSDGTGGAAEVTTRLVYRRADGLYSGGAEWSSNSNLLDTEENTIDFQDNPHDLTANGVYSFFVTIARTNVNESPAFSGIDFAPPPVQ